MKKLKILKENDLYGFCIEDKIYVNLELLYNDSKNETAFIDNYCKVYTHELLHSIIKDIVFDLYVDKEEEIVDKISKTNRLKLK